MSLFSLKKVFTAWKKEIPIDTHDVTKTLWKGRFISSCSSDSCHSKCDKFNPNKRCCKKREEDPNIMDDNCVSEDVVINPLFSWHPLNLFHPKDAPQSKQIKLEEASISDSDIDDGE